jgi:hypothetical protein
VGTAGHRRSVAGLPNEGRLSPSAALDDALAGIAAIDDDLSAVVAIDADGARRAAAVADAELKCVRWRGQLHGVPIAVKELFDVAPARYLRFARTRRGCRRSACNESPLGASARVVTAITGAALQAHRYPDPLAGALRAELAALHDVHPDQILVGNGSVDEAYVEFTDGPDATTCLPLVASGRVAVLRTFSKIYGLAGLRVGYLIADPGIITTLRKIRAPFSVGTIAQAGALAALGDPGHSAQVRAGTLRARPAAESRRRTGTGSP